MGAVVTGSLKYTKKAKPIASDPSDSGNIQAMLFDGKSRVPIGMSYAYGEGAAVSAP